MDQATIDKHYGLASCLDSAYERQAILDGHTFDEKYLYPENKQLYKDIQNGI